MIVCSNCGRRMDDACKFCKACGARIGRSSGAFVFGLPILAGLAVVFAAIVSVTVIMRYKASPVNRSAEAQVEPRPKPSLTADREKSVAPESSERSQDLGTESRKNPAEDTTERNVAETNDVVPSEKDRRGPAAEESVVENKSVVDAVIGMLSKSCVHFSDVRNQGKFPKTISELIPKYIRDRTSLRHPDRADDEIGFYYVPGLSLLDSDAKVVLIYEAPKEGTDPENYLIADAGCEVAVLPREKFKDWMKNTQRRLEDRGIEMQVEPIIVSNLPKTTPAMLLNLLKERIEGTEKTKAAINKVPLELSWELEKLKKEVQTAINVPGLVSKENIQELEERQAKLQDLIFSLWSKQHEPVPQGTND